MTQIDVLIFLAVFAFLQVALLGGLLWFLRRTRMAITDAEAGFARLCDGLKDIEHLQEVNRQVDQISKNLADAHGKIGSQLHATGEVVTQLQQLVARWSSEGSDLQRSYTTLAKAMEEAIVHKSDALVTLGVQLEQTLATLAVAAGPPPASSIGASQPMVAR